MNDGRDERSALGTIEGFVHSDHRFEFRDSASYSLINKLLEPYGYFMMPTPESVSGITVAVLQRKKAR